MRRRDSHGCNARAREKKTAHVPDVEHAGVRASRNVLAHDTGRIVQGQVPAAERHHARLLPHVSFEQGRLQQRRAEGILHVVAARMLHRAPYATRSEPDRIEGTVYTLVRKPVKFEPSSAPFTKFSTRARPSPTLAGTALMKRLDGFHLLLGSLMAGVLVLSGCDQAGSQPGGMPPPEVSVVEVKLQTLPVSYEYVGQTQGSRDVEVRARVTGILLKRNFREGALVSRGQSLFTIDPAPFQIALQRAQAEVAAADARLDQARRNAARLRPLVEAKAASQKDYDDAVAAERIADADVRLAKAKLAEANLNLQYTRVEAPLTGITSRAARSEGALISGPEVLLGTITQTDPIWVTFGIPEREHLAIRNAVAAGQLQLPKNGFEVTVRLSDGSEFERKGRLDFSDVRVNPATGTTETRAELPNPRGQVKPGQFVRVHLGGAILPDAMLVPQKAVLEGPQGKFVYVVNADSKAEPRPVQVGEWRGEDWIIRSGLKPGEQVIVSGLLKLGPGAPVKIAAAAPPDAAAKPPAGLPPAQKK